MFTIDTVSCILAASLALNAVLCGALCITTYRNRLQNKRASEKEKNDALFLRTVTHDLRSPLANIKGFAELIAAGSLSKEKSEEALYLIAAEADRLAALAGRLAEGEDAPLDFSVFDLSELMHTVVLTLTPKAERRGLSFNEKGFCADNAFYVRADERRTREAVYNLCDNAVKYADENTAVTLSLYEENGRIFGSVENFCADFDAAELSEITHAGYRGKSSKSSAGSGLGLYVAEKIFADHAAELGEECALVPEYADGILRFRFSLPKAGEYTEDA